MKEIEDILAEWARRRDEPLALATLVRARGSSYRQPGARMLIAGDGTTVGVLSGGCLEEEVADRARETTASGIPRLLSFDTRLRYGCEGAIEVLVEKVQPQFFAEITSALQARSTCIVVTEFARRESSGSRVLRPGEETPAEAFVQILRPPIQLLLIGPGPDSAALQTFASTLGWKLMEVEEATLLPNELDEWTAAVVKTHNYGRDYAALARLLPMKLRYLALLGPRHRRDQLLHALQEAGIAGRSELFAPAGLDLGAESPEEIALAIVSEIQAVFANATAASLRERKTAIHLLPDFAAA